MTETTANPTETSGDAPAQDLESRIAYLEAQNEGLKRVGGLALVLLLLTGGLFAYQVRNDLKGIATRGVVLHDERDVARFAVTVSPQGSLGVVPINPLGGAPQMMPMQGDMHGITVYDSQGRPRIVFGLTPEDQPVVGILGPDGQPVWTPAGGPRPAQAPPKGPAASATPAAPAASPSKAPTPASPTASPSLP